MSETSTPRSCRGGVRFVRVLDYELDAFSERARVDASRCEKGPDVQGLLDMVETCRCANQLIAAPALDVG
jgi:hypothetical protein